MTLITELIVNYETVQAILDMKQLREWTSNLKVILTKSYGNRVVYVHREKYIYIFNHLDQKVHQRGFSSGVLRFPPVSSNLIFMEVLPMKKKQKKFKLFDIQTGLVLVINDESRRTEKHNETCEIVALGRECKIKVNEFSMLKMSN